MSEMTPIQRVLTTLSHNEPDRVPFIFTTTTWGAKLLGLSIKEYLSSAESYAEGQLRIWKMFGQDLLYNLFYAAVEVEAWGSKTIFAPDGPPNAGAPIITSLDDIDKVVPPRVGESPVLQRTLEATRIMRKGAGDDVPIVGVVMSPFSVAVMQMGFERYLDLIYEEPQYFWKLMEKNQSFCTEWANAQLAAGATAIGYFDPVSSPTVVPPSVYRSTGQIVAKQTIAQINGPTATHFASGRTLQVIDDIADTGTAIIGVSANEDIAEVKSVCNKRLSVLGNLNALEMRRWTIEETEQKVKQAIAAAGPGGGFILGENHGEIPWQAPGEILQAIADAVRTWGKYPLDWVEEYNSAASTHA